MVDNTLEFVEKLESKGFEFAEFNPCEWAYERHKNGKPVLDDNGRKVLVVDKDGNHVAIPQRKIKLSRPDSSLVPDWFKDDFQGGWLGIPKGSKTEGGSVVVDVDSKEYPDNLLSYATQTVTVPTAKGNHLYLLYKDEFDPKHRGFNLDGIHCDLGWDKIGKQGQGIYLPPFSKYRNAETLEAPVTHDVEDDVLARNFAYLAGNAKEDIEIGGDKYKSTSSSSSKKGKSNNSKKVVFYANAKVPEGNRYAAIRDTAWKLMHQGWDKESREYVANLINDSFCDGHYDEGTMQRLFDDLDKTQQEKGLKCPYTLIHNTREEGIPTIIVKCMEKLGYEFRVNVRGMLKEGRIRDGEWMTKEDKLWRSYLRTEFQNRIKHSLSVKVKKDENGTYLGIQVEAKDGKFPVTDIQDVFDVVCDGKEYDPFDDYLESDAIREKVDLLQEQHCHKDADGNFKIEDPTVLPIFNCVEEIVQYEPNKHIKKKYPQVDYEYWRWFLWMSVFPAIYNTKRPGERFTEVVLLMGPQGAFKSSLFEFLLPKELRHMAIKTSFLEDEKEMFRKFDQAVFAIIDEMDGFWKSEETNLRILGSRADEYRQLWKEQVRVALRRCSIIMTTNHENPLKMSRDAQRRWNPDTIWQNEGITKKGIEEGKTAQGYMDYLEEWADRWREWIYASCLLMYECGWQPGLPGELNKKREEAVKLASGTDEFKGTIKDLLQSWRNADNKAIDMKAIFDRIPYKRTKEKTEIILECVAEMGGHGEFVTGRYEIYEDGKESPTQKNQQHIDIKDIPKTNTDEYEKDGRTYREEPFDMDGRERFGRAANKSAKDTNGHLNWN